MRQRTLPEQRELLRGLGQTRPAAEPPRPGARPKPARRDAAPHRRRRRRRGATAPAEGGARLTASRARPRAGDPRRPWRRTRRRASTHLAENRRLIVRRALLATAVGGVIPIPVLDDYFAGRCARACSSRSRSGVGSISRQASADLLGDPREGNAVRNATLTAATLLALKLAWRKFFALLAIGRRAEDMATSFQLGMVFDHYCAKLHVGARRRSARRRRPCARRSSARCPSRNGRRSWPRFATGAGARAVRSSRRRTG